MDSDFALVCVEGGRGKRKEGGGGGGGGQSVGPGRRGYDACVCMSVYVGYSLHAAMQTVFLP